jgi:hexosaminidase
MSPAPHTYLDQKYDDDTELGLSWAGNVEVRDAYEWDPGDALGVEAALWTETVEDFDAITYLSLPRLPAVAEVAWSHKRDFDDFARRLAAHGAQWEAEGLAFHRSPEIPWGVRT